MSFHSLEIPTYLPGKTNSSEDMRSGELTLPKGSCVLSGSREWLGGWTLRPASKDAGLQRLSGGSGTGGGSSFCLGSSPVSLPAGATPPSLSLSLAKAARPHEEAGLLPSAKVMEVGANSPQGLGPLGLPRGGGA